MFNFFKISQKEFLLSFLFKGFLAEILLAYKDFSKSFDRQLSLGFSESRLLAYSFFISFILFLQRLPNRVSQNSEYINNISLRDQIGIDLFASVFFVPIFLYFIASFFHIMCLPFGSNATFFESRLAFFWSTVVSFPIILSFSILEIFINYHIIFVILKYLSIICYAWIFSVIFCKAQKFSSNLYIFSALFILYLIFNFFNFSN